MRKTLPSIFNEVQSSVTNHYKNATALRTLHLRAATDEASQLLFEEEFLEMLSRVISVRKDEPNVEKTFQFVIGYIRLLYEFDSPLHASQSCRIGADITPSFLSRLLDWFLQGFQARRTIVRHRCVYLAANLVQFSQNLGKEEQRTLRTLFIQRTLDKEPKIRSMSAVALSSLASSASFFTEDFEETVGILLDILAQDPVSDVRRIVLVHIPIIPQTIEAILIRSRDVSKAVRKALFSTVLAKMDPRHALLNQSRLAMVIAAGFADSEESACTATGRLISKWLGIISRESNLPISSPSGGISPEECVPLLAFIELFDIAESTGRHAAQLTVSWIINFHIGPTKMIRFEEEYWRTLTPHSAFFAHAVLANSKIGVCEHVLIPESSVFALYLQDTWNTISEYLDKAEQVLITHDTLPDDDRVFNFSSILGDLLSTSPHLDLTDEHGRQRLFAIGRALLSQDMLPTSLIEGCVKLIFVASPNEKEFVRIVVEILIDLRDPLVDEVLSDTTSLTTNGISFNTTTTSVRHERSLQRQTPLCFMHDEERLEAEIIDGRCLLICSALLKHIRSTMEEHSVLEGVLKDLVIPCVQSEREMISRSAMRCLALLCLLSKKLAEKLLPFLVNQIEPPYDDRTIDTLQAIFDIICVHGSSALSNKVTSLSLHIFENTQLHELQWITCLGLAKMVLSGVVENYEVLSALALAYVSPAVETKGEIQEVIASFFSLYCHTSDNNQNLLRTAFIPALKQATVAFEECTPENSIITPLDFALLFIDWLTPSSDNYSFHCSLAIDILKVLYSSEDNGVFQSVLCALLKRLDISSDIEDHSLNTIRMITSQLHESTLTQSSDNKSHWKQFETKLQEKFADRFSQPN